jgi:hypothetical protein
VFVLDDDFTQVLHNDNSNVVLNELNTFIDNINTDSVTPDQENGIVNDLGNVLLNAASSTFGQNQRICVLFSKMLLCLFWITIVIRLNIFLCIFDSLHSVQDDILS